MTNAIATRVHDPSMATENNAAFTRSTEKCNDIPILQIKHYDWDTLTKYNSIICKKKLKD